MPFCRSGAAVAQLNAQIAEFVQQVRGCVDQSGDFVGGHPKNVDVLVQKHLHTGVVIRTGRCRVTIAKGMRGPIHIRGDQQSGLSYQIGDGVWHPLTDLAQPMSRTG